MKTRLTIVAHYPIVKTMLTIRHPKVIFHKGPVAQWIERPPPKRQVGRPIRPRIKRGTFARPTGSLSHLISAHISRTA